MDSKELIERLAELQILCVRYVERNTNLVCKTNRDLNRIIMQNKFTVTIETAIKNLKKNIKEYCNDSSYLIDSITELESNIEGSSIKYLRLGNENNTFTDQEIKLNNFFLIKQLDMQTGLYSIKEIAQELDLKEETIKKAAQQEKLLNTKKVGKAWLVDYKEVKKYWNK